MVRHACTIREFHLIDDEAIGPVAGAPAGRLVVPAGLSRLVVTDRPRIVGGRGPSACVLEPVRRGNDAGLLLLTAPQRPVRVNGWPVDGAVLLRERDVVQVDGFMLHVTVYVRAEIGIAPDEHADSRCLTCRGAVKGTRVYLCSQCGAPIHCDREGDGDDCLLGSDCPGCRTPIRFDGYSYLPEGA